MKDRGTLLGSLGAAVLASACCLGPLILGALGVGSFGLASVVAPLRPWLLLLTAALLGVAFYFAYRPLRDPDCGPDGACARPPNQTLQRFTLWLVTVLTLALATYPTWGARLFSRPPTPIASAANDVVVLEVAGMTCAACEGGVEEELRRVPGVVAARVDYPSGTAEIRFATATTDVGPLIAAVERAGYRASAAGDALAGIANAHGGRDSLVLKRTGEAEFAEDFLALERVADDPTRLAPLSSNAAELRKRFNDDRKYTRLVMLLSPS